MQVDDFEPALRSLALRAMPDHDWAEVVVVRLPSAAPGDPRAWAQAVFDIRAMPRWVLALLSLRQVVVKLIGVPPADRHVFDVNEVCGNEALISADDRHLDFRCGVGVDTEQRLLWITTVVRLKGWRGRVYFAPVALLHQPVTRSMARAAIRRRTSGTHPARP